MKFLYLPEDESFLRGWGMIRVETHADDSLWELANTCGCICHGPNGTFAGCMHCIGGKMTVEGFSRGDEVTYQDKECKVLSVGEMMIKIKTPEGEKKWVWPNEVSK